MGHQEQRLGADEGQEGQPDVAGIVQLHLHDGRLRRARFGCADPPAGRHARPDGQAGRLDHRNADYRELPRRAERAAVLHLDARRAQGSGRHGVEDRELRLSDAPSGGRDPGPGGDRGRLRHDQRCGDEGPDRGRRGGRGLARAHSRPRGRQRRGQSREQPDRLSRPARCWTKRRWSASRRWASTKSRCARRSPATRAMVCAPSATGAIWAAGRSSTSAKRSA